MLQDASVRLPDLRETWKERKGKSEGQRTAEPPVISAMVAVLRERESAGSRDCLLTRGGGEVKKMRRKRGRRANSFILM